jgi:hypothetical protein
MKATLVSICPTDAARAAGRLALTPELLAATGARYSRNNEGLAAIAAKIDPNRLDASVDSIFRMLDSGRHLPRRHLDVAGLPCLVAGGRRRRAGELHPLHPHFS